MARALLSTLSLVAGVPPWVGNGPSGAIYYLQYPQGNNLGQIKGDMMYLNVTKIFIFLAVVWQRTNPSFHPTLL